MNTKPLIVIPLLALLIGGLLTLWVAVETMPAPAGGVPAGRSPAPRAPLISGDTPRPAITMQEPAAGAEIPGYWTPRWFTICADQAVDVHGSPGPDALITGQLHEGDRVRVREWSHNGNGWAMIAPAQWINGADLCW